MEGQNTNLAPVLALRKFHMTDGQNTCDQITSAGRSRCMIKLCSVHSSHS